VGLLPSLPVGTGLGAPFFGGMPSTANAQTPKIEVDPSRQPKTESQQQSQQRTKLSRAEEELFYKSFT